jgi:hypothetical protein
MSQTEKDIREKIARELEEYAEEAYSEDSSLYAPEVQDCVLQLPIGTTSARLLREYDENLERVRLEKIKEDRAKKRERKKKEKMPEQLEEAKREIKRLKSELKKGK